MENNDTSCRLTIIVPFYNVEQYIEECILSLYDQDIPREDYEVIAIDDCSPDGSRAIVLRLQQQYPTLRLFTCPENLRQGGARNIGLEHAKGEYVWFVDSDDTIIPNCLNGLLSQAAENNLDILDFDFIQNGQNGFNKGNLSYEMGPCSGEEYIFDNRVKWDWKCCCVCAGIIKRKLIEDNHLRFAEHVQYEDCDYALMLYAKANRVKHIPYKAYAYRTVENSSVHKEISLTQIQYRTELIKRYIYILRHSHLSAQWNNGIRELINDCCNEIICFIPQLSCQERKNYYRQKQWKIANLNNYIGIRKRFLLRSYIFLQYSQIKQKR